MAAEYCLSFKISYKYKLSSEFFSNALNLTRRLAGQNILPARASILLAVDILPHDLSAFSHCVDCCTPKEPYPTHLSEFDLQVLFQPLYLVCHQRDQAFTGVTLLLWDMGSPVDKHLHHKLATQAVTEEPWWTTLWHHRYESAKYEGA